jgi:hypothetical protein
MREFWIEMSKNDEPRTVWTDHEMSRFLEIEDLLGLKKRSIQVIEKRSYDALAAKLAIALEALEDAKETFHYVYCMSEKSHSMPCDKIIKALAKIGGAE